VGSAEGMMTMEQSLAELIRGNRITRDTALAHCSRMDASASHHREFLQSRLWAVVRAGGDGTGLQSLTKVIRGGSWYGQLASATTSGQPVN
jgi:hypothetical protein